MRRRLAAIDVGIAALAFVASAATLLRHGPVAGELREPDALAYVLPAGYSGSVVLRRRLPEGALVLALAAVVAYAALTYPKGLTFVGRARLVGDHLQPRAD